MKHLQSGLQLGLTAWMVNLLRRGFIFWLSLSLTFSASYSFMALRKAFSSEYIVQDDARQHVFWMQRFLDPALFPNDLIADYFQSVAPAGYKLVYQIAAALGSNPLLTSKVFPLILGLITTGYCFALCLEILPLPVAGFIASLLLNQVLWIHDDLVSATPRAFIYPLLLAFFYYLIRRSILPCAATIVLQGLFYPQSVFISAGLLLLQLVKREGKRLHLSRVWKDYRFCAVGLGAALLVMIPYALSSSEFGPVITVAEAKGLREFQVGGRSSFFIGSPWQFWLDNPRSGILPNRGRLPSLLFATFLLPILLCFPAWFPLSRQVKGGVNLLLQIILVSLGCFFAAHALLFRLHLPSRYTQHTLRIVLCLAAAIALVILLDALLTLASTGILRARRSRSGQWSIGTTAAVGTKLGLAIAAVVLVGGMLLLFPKSTNRFPITAYVTGKQPDLYQFFAQQPKNILIASLSEEADQLPTFAHRSVLVGKEYGIPYHMGYYRQFSQRTEDLLQAQYSPDLAVVKQFIQQYKIDFWLIDQNAFTPSYVAHGWTRQYSTVTQAAKTSLRRGNKPALSQVSSCTAFQNKDVLVLAAPCLINQPLNQPPT